MFYLIPTIILALACPSHAANLLYNTGFETESAISQVIYTNNADIVLYPPGSKVPLAASNPHNGSKSIRGNVSGYITTLNNRYIKNASGNAKFLLGYYKWHPVNMDDYGTEDSPSNLRQVIDNAATSGANYVRVTKLNSGLGTTGHENPFLYSGGKTDLNQWDSAFWTNLKASIAYAATKGVIVNYTLFNGVHYRVGAELYRWGNSFWNPANHSDTFYSDPDENENGSVDEDGEFYNTSAFNAGTGIGYYQKAYIDKLITETGSYANVMYSVGNETKGASEAWLAAVRAYVGTKTSKLITVNRCLVTSCTVMSSDPGVWEIHGPLTAAEVKSELVSTVGDGYPVMMDEIQAPGEPTAAQTRQYAWYSLTGGAAGWGGWSLDWWDESLNVDRMTYYKHLQDFLTTTGVRFWNMTPQHSLISDNTTNSLLANTGVEYLGYVLSGTSVEITLATGSYGVKYYNPVTGVFTTGSDTTGPATRTFNRPSGASDWVVYVFANTL